MSVATPSVTKAQVAAGPRWTCQSGGWLVALLSIVGVASVFSTAIYLYGLWTQDPLKSIGSFVPVVSFLLILRAWRSLGWEMRGTWWGLALLALTVGLVHLRDRAILELVLSPSWSIFLPPHSLVAVMYAAGLVLLFGGVPLLRATWFPVLLMWLVNPVPHFFTLHVDLPLQHASAHIARAWAQGLGYPLTPDNLRLMFTPEFGMFIAPGCNGIRGAITMGFIALIAGYVYRFRWPLWLGITVAAVMLGYVFNFIRLCVLVLYYIVALHITWLQSRAEMGDYIIGACLFLLATILLFATIRRWSPTRDLRPPSLPSRGGNPEARVPPSFWRRLAALAVLLLLGSASYAMAEWRDRTEPPVNFETAARFPARVGGWKLDRTWNEHLIAGGALIFNWGTYLPVGGKGPTISVGLSPVLGTHDTLLCHAARGEDWLWHDALQLPTQDGPVSFSGSFFNDGATQYLEATTMCTGTSCGQTTSDRRHFGLVYSRPDTHDLLGLNPARPIPVLLRAETTDTALAPDLARRQLTDSMADFLKSASLPSFTAAYRQP